MTVSITVAGVAYSVPSSAADTDWAAEQVALEQALATAANTALNGTWTPAVLVNSWASVGGFQAMQYRVNGQGDVDLRGRINSGASGTTATTLPAGYRPPKDIIFNGTNITGITRILIETTGVVVVTTLTGDATTGTQFDGITFSTTA